MDDMASLKPACPDQTMTESQETEQAHRIHRRPGKWLRSLSRGRLLHQASWLTTVALHSKMRAWRKRLSFSTWPQSAELIRCGGVPTSPAATPSAWPRFGPQVIAPIDEAAPPDGPRPD
ncbi:hypothetical protein AUP68_03952 [Ilyonectria robusta]